MKLQSKSTYYLSILSLGIILYLLGVIIIFSIHSQQVSKYLRKQQSFIIDLKDEIAQADIYMVRENLESIDDVDPESIRFIPREEGLEFMKNALADEELFLNMENPLQDVYEFRLANGEMSTDRMQALEKEIKKLPGVLGLHYQQDPFSSIDRLKYRMNSLLLIIIALMFLFSLVLIFNTLRLMLSNQRKRIFTMQMVGARDRFILRPYLKTGASIGWWAGVIAAVLLLISYLTLLRFFELPSDFLNIPVYFIISIGMIILGVLFSFICAYVIVTRYLRSVLEYTPD